MKDAPTPIAVGDVIDGKYRVERVIGSGGMGVVVAAQHLKLGRTVALKFLLEHACESREAVSRFLREGQALARITSAHVARVMDVGTLPHGEPYLVMEYLEGSDLGAVLRARGPLPIAEAAGYVLEACEAVAEAHANGIVHRDLKPSNLFLSQGADGEPIVKVLDFGISKAVVQHHERSAPATGPDAPTAAPTHDTSTGALVGSPLYMSPEQIRNARRVDERTDIWALGVILYELVCGRPPFEGETLAGTLAAVAADTPAALRTRRSDVPPELEAVAMRCLEKAPEKRFANVGALARALEPFAPRGAHASVERILRLLRDAPPEVRVALAASTSLGDTAPTVPSWEGDTVPMSGFTAPVRKRHVALVTLAVGVLAGGALVFLRAPAPATSPVSERDGSPGAEPPPAAAAAAPPSERASAVPVSSASVTATASAPPMASATPSAAHGRKTTEPRRLSGAPPRNTRPERANATMPSLGKESDGTEDRK